MEELNINKYIETTYFQSMFDEKPIDVFEFNAAFSINRHYNSFAPTLRHGLADIMVEVKTESDVDYRFDFKEELTYLDRYAVIDRVALYSLMRVYLPSFTIIYKDVEIKIDAFASAYENSYCSVTYVYNLNGILFNHDISNLITNWAEMKDVYITIDPNTFKLLKIINENINLEEASYIRMPVIDLINSIKPKDKFSFAKDIIYTILREYYSSSLFRKAEDIVFQYNEYRANYRYYQFKCDEKFDINNQNLLNNMVRGMPTNYLSNPNMVDMGMDLSQYTNSKIYGYEDMLLNISRNDFNSDLDLIVTHFMLFDYFIIEKLKHYFAIKEFKEYEDSEDVNLEDLVNIRTKIFRKLNNDIIYYFPEDRFHFANAVSKCLNIKKYYTELENIYLRINDTVVKLKELEKEKNERRVNYLFQLLTLIFAIPAVSIIVDILYADDMPKIFILPMSYTKILWIVVVFLVCFLVIHNRKSMKDITRRVKEYMIQKKNNIRDAYRWRMLQKALKNIKDNDMT